MKRLLFLSICMLLLNPNTVECHQETFDFNFNFDFETKLKNPNTLSAVLVYNIIINSEKSKLLIDGRLDFELKAIENKANAKKITKNKSKKKPAKVANQKKKQPIAKVYRDNIRTKNMNAKAYLAYSIKEIKKKKL